MKDIDKIAILVEGSGGRQEYRNWDEINPTEPAAGAPVDAVAATATIEFLLAGTKGKKITINDVTYTLTDELKAINEVMLGATAAATAESLTHAINGEGTSGTDYYAGTKKPTDITASLDTATIILTAKTAGTSAHDYLLSTDSPEADMTLIPFADGVDGTVAKIGKILIDDDGNVYIATTDCTTADSTGWKKLAFATEDAGQEE